jgi:small subunit ribosomal protein S5
MEQEIKQTNTVNTEVKPNTPISSSVAPTDARPFDKKPRGNRKDGGRPPREQKERIKPEFDTKIINIRRVTRVVSGGRRFTFSVAVVSGDKKGRVGVGLGKSGDTSMAIDKATRDAKKNMIRIPLSSSMTIPHAVQAKYSSAIVMMMPAKGRGVVAGSSARNVIELGGVKDICVKLLSGSKNKLNIARATIKALSMLSKNPGAKMTKSPNDK